MITALCIGGPLDGQKKVTEGVEIHALASLPPLKFPVHVESGLTIASEGIRYVILTVSSPTGQFYLAVPEGLSFDAAMQMLIDGYKP